MTFMADVWGMHGDVGTGWTIVMAVGMVVFWGAIIALIVWALSSRSGTSAERPEDPAAVLDRRLAHGDITPQEYEQRRALLSGAPGPG